MRVYSVVRRRNRDDKCYTSVGNIATNIKRKPALYRCVDT